MDHWKMKMGAAEDRQEKRTTYLIGASEVSADCITTSLPDSSALIADSARLRDKMEEDGFLFIPGFHEREEVLNVRREILERLTAQGQLEPQAPLMEGVVHPDFRKSSSVSVRGRENLRTESLRRMLYGERTLGFFARFFGEDPTYLNYQWLRAVGPEGGSMMHYDFVFMGRGSARLYTCWTPLGDLTLDMGPLVVCLGSHRWEKVIQTYGKADVDRDRIEGYFTRDAGELLERFGGRFATTPFEAGDVVILSMHMMHASLTNVSNRFRISCDSRYQPKSELIDDRWSGENPKGHSEFWKAAEQLEPLEVSRHRWGV